MFNAEESISIADETQIRVAVHTSYRVEVIVEP